jgi:hypothetical protein
VGEGLGKVYRERFKEHEGMARRFAQQRRGPEKGKK